MSWSARLMKKMAELDATMTNPNGEGTNDRPPTGDDYNALYSLVMEEIEKSPELVMGMLDRVDRIPYSSYLMSFVHDGMEIRNPYVSECGRFAADPVDDYGFEEVDSGMGCVALQKITADGRTLWLTDSSGCLTPDEDNLPPSLLGLRIDGETVLWVTLQDIPFSDED